MAKRQAGAKRGRKEVLWSVRRAKEAGANMTGVDGKESGSTEVSSAIAANLI